jgi:hypothetical protein
VTGELHVLATLLRGKKPKVVMEKEAGWVPGQAWTIWTRKNILPQPEIEPWIIQQITNHYTDYAFLASYF